MQIKVFESLFCFFQAPTIKSYHTPGPWHCWLEGQIPTKIYCKQKIRIVKYKKVLALLAFMFGSSFEAKKRNKSLNILLKDCLNVMQFVYHKEKGDLILQFQFFEQLQLHSCSNHSNLEMEADYLTKTLSYLNLNISRTKHGRNKL